jgi:hypothetical protein
MQAPARAVRAGDVVTENQIQKAIFAHLRQRGAPGAFAFHPKNGGIHQRGRHRGINNGLGVVSGVPDVIVIHQGRTYGLELKKHGGKLSQAQIETLEQMEHAGAIVDTATGLDAALRWLEDHRLLVGRTS